MKRGRTPRGGGLKALLGGGDEAESAFRGETEDEADGDSKALERPQRGRGVGGGAPCFSLTPMRWRAWS